MKNRAFTLIELLVVIAIIAILAAILFPVFAQAKLAAKQAANISNVKNLSLGVLIYATDGDDYFPLAQRAEPANVALFGVDPWQVSVQPYIKNWGVFVHPLGPVPPANNAALAAWKQTNMYGTMARAQNSGYTNYQASTSLGSFARRVCGSQPCKYDGIMGQGCDATLGCGFYAGGSGISVSSLSTTAVSNSADQLMISEGAFWDLYSQVLGASATPLNPCTYGVSWSPAVYNPNGTGNSMACPSARRAPLAQAPDGACTPANLCDGFANFGIQNGLSTYAATDGHAVARSYRGGLMKNATIADGSVVITSMWPSGGF